MSRSAQEINEDYAERMKKVFNAGDAAIMFAFAMNKDRQKVIFATNDLTPLELANELESLVAVLRKPFKPMTDDNR